MAGRRLVVLAALTAAPAAAAGAQACACCADRSSWSEQTAPLQSYERSELARVRFAPKAFDLPSPEGGNGAYTAGGSSGARRGGSRSPGSRS